MGCADHGMEPGDPKETWLLVWNPEKLPWHLAELALAGLTLLFTCELCSQMCW